MSKKETRSQQSARMTTVASSAADAPRDAPPFHPEAVGEPHPQAPEPRAADVAVLSSKPVRTTVVLSPVEYDRLQTFVTEVGRRTGRRGVAGSEVVRVLLGLLDDPAAGPELRHRVEREIRDHGGNRRRGPSGT